MLAELRSQPSSLVGVLTRLARVTVVAVLVSIGSVYLSSKASSAATSPSGTVAIGEPLTGLGDSVQFDPTLGHTSQVQNPWQMAIYGTLLRPTPNNGYLPELATSATIQNPSTINITLRRGVVFSDGTPFDANAVKVGILRNRNAPQLGSLSNLLQDISNISVLNSTTLSIDFSAPVAGAFYPLLASQETFIVAPTSIARGQLNTNPVGAGPFLLSRYIPNESITLVRNARYWDAKSIHVAKLQYVNVPSGPQQVNVLESGQVNVSQIPVNDATAVRENGGFRVTATSPQTQSLWLPVCKSSPPLSNVRVRKALNYAIDRNAINRAVLSNLGEPQWALWPGNSIYFPPGLKGYYSYNTRKAKALLAAAGYKNGFSTRLLVISGTPVESETASIVQAEWQKIGVNVSLVQTTDLVGGLYEQHVAPMGLLPQVRGGIEALTGPFQPGTIGDICNFNSPTLDSITSKLSALSPSSPQAVSLTRQAQSYIVTNALGIWIAFQPYVYATSTNVSGVQFLTQYAQPIPYFWSLRVS